MIIAISIDIPIVSGSDVGAEDISVGDYDMSADECDTVISSASEVKIVENTKDSAIYINECIEISERDSLEDKD